MPFINDMWNIRTAGDDSGEHEITDRYIRRHADLAQEANKVGDYDRMNAHIGAARAHWVYRYNRDEGSKQLADYLSQVANNHKSWENPNMNARNFDDVREGGSILPTILESIKPKGSY